MNRIFQLSIVVGLILVAVSKCFAQDRDDLKWGVGFRVHSPLMGLVV